jgi:Tfp pilus assembly protein PilF
MKLARMALSGRDFAAAADWANQALEIDVTDADAHRVLAEARLATNNYPGAIEEYQTAIGLDPDEPHQRFALADAYLQAGKPREARRALEALLQLVPDYPGAELLLETVKEKEEEEP